MDTRFKIGIGTLIIFALIYRLIFNDSIASNYEVPPGYSAPKSIAQIQAEEQKAFETALAQALPQEAPTPVAEMKTMKIVRKKTVPRKLAKMVGLKLNKRNKTMKRKVERL